MERANKPQKPQGNTIELDSDSEPEPANQPSRFLYSASRSNNSSQHPRSRTNHTKQSSHASNVKEAAELPRYEEVIGFKHLKRMASLDVHQHTIRKFLETKNYNFLFLFGPSGCGKTLLVEEMLRQSGVSYEYAVPKVQETEDGDVQFQDIFSMLEEVLQERSTLSEKVLLFKEFPLATSECGSDYLSKFRIFRESIHYQIGRCHNYNKNIFILNTEIYSPFYLLNQNSETKSLSKQSNVMVIKMDPYGIREMKSIMQHFVSSHPLYSSVLNSQLEVDEVVTEANGDARKALHLIYHSKIRDVAHKMAASAQNGWGDGQLSQKKSKQSLKEEQKVTIFHMLGKFLYGKRSNLYYNPRSRVKEEKQVSSYYSQEELSRLDPKFYFQPVELLSRSHMTLPVFSQYLSPQFRLLYQNFINRYGSVQDLAKMSEIFMFYDSYLSGSLNRFQLIQQMQQILKQLHCWGILIYNRNSVRDRKLYRIQRSSNHLNQQLIKTKREILKSHYTQNIEGGRYRLRDVMNFAVLTRTPRYKLDYSLLHQKLIELLTDRRKSSFPAEVDSHLSVIQGEDQDMAQDNCSRVNSLGQAIVTELNHRRNMIALAIEDSDESDIDSQS